MTKEDLRISLLQYKQDVWDENKDKTINAVINDIIDFENDNQNWDLDDYTYTFTGIDMMEEYIKNRLKDFWLSQVSRDLQSVDSDDDYYKIDDVDGEVIVISVEEIQDWIDEIIETLDWIELEETED